MSWTRKLVLGGILTATPINILVCYQGFQTASTAWATSEHSPSDAASVETPVTSQKADPLPTPPDAVPSEPMPAARSAFLDKEMPGGPVASASNAGLLPNPPLPEPLAVAAGPSAPLAAMPPDAVKPASFEDKGPSAPPPGLPQPPMPPAPAQPLASGPPSPLPGPLPPIPRGDLLAGGPAPVGPVGVPPSPVPPVVPIAPTPPPGAIADPPFPQGTGARPISAREIPTPVVATPPPEPKQPEIVASPWAFDFAIVDGKTLLTAKVSEEVQFRITCDHLEMQAPRGSIVASGNIVLTSAGLKGNSDRLTINLQEERVLLDGKAHVSSQREGQELDVQGERLSLRLRGGATAEETQSKKDVRPRGN